MIDLAKLKYASQRQEGAGLPTCVQVIVPAADGSFCPTNFVSLFTFGRETADSKYR